MGLDSWASFRPPASSGIWEPVGGFPADPEQVVSFPHNFDMNTEAAAIRDNVWRHTRSGPGSTPLAGTDYDWNATGAFDNTPSTRLYPPTTDQTDCGWGPFENIQTNLPNTYVLSVGFVIKLGPELLNRRDNIKLIIVSVVLKTNDESFGQRPMTFLTNDTVLDQATYEACDGTVCINDFGINLYDHINQPLYVEQVSDLVNQTNKLYIFDRSNTYGLSEGTPWLTKSLTESSVLYHHRNIDVLGYQNYASPLAAFNSDCWREYSHLQVSGGYQGPPPGFLT